MDLHSVFQYEKITVHEKHRVHKQSLIVDVIDEIIHIINFQLNYIQTKI